MSMVGRAWRGEAKLWKTFWIGGAIVYFLPYAIRALLKLAEPAAGAIVLVVGIFYIVLPILWLIAVWRCAFNVRIKFFAYLARLMVICIPLAMLGLPLLMSGGMIRQVFAKADECKKALTARAQAAGLSYEQYVKIHENENERCGFGGVNALNNPQPVSVNGITITMDDDIRLKGCEAQMMIDEYKRTGKLNTTITDNRPYFEPCRQSLSIQNIAAPAAVISSQPQSAQQICETQMTNYALQYKADPKAYIASNQAYLQQCVQQLSSKLPSAK